MLYKIASSRLSVTNYFAIKLDRIFIFVNRSSEIETLRELNFHHFEFSTRNVEQGTISHIFFFKNITLELIKIENRELATQYSSQSNIDLISRTRWRSTLAVPFGFVLYYAGQKSRSRRRCYHTEKEVDSSKPFLETNFSSKNLKKLQEPVCYIVPEALTAKNLLDNTLAIEQRILSDLSTTNKLTNIQITLDPSMSPTKTVSSISAMNIIDIKRGNCPKLELKFGSSNRSRSTCLDSTPVVFYY